MNKITVSIQDIDEILLEKEIEKRQKLSIIKNNLWSYCKKLDEDFFTDDKTILYDIANRIQRVKEGQVKKLAISVYPRVS